MIQALGEQTVAAAVLVVMGTFATACSSGSPSSGNPDGGPTRGTDAASSGDGGTPTPPPGFDASSLDAAAYLDATCSIQTNACTACESARCCPDLAACLASPECQKYTLCIEGCGATVRCYESCNATYTSVAVQAEKFELCVVDHCGTECGDEAKP
jgi:hypothetical protein